jgi:ABC-type branched-subunit amino acid transport system ATPase component
MRTADSITVLAGGGLIAEGPPQVILEDQRVKEVYIGSAGRP